MAGDELFPELPETRRLEARAAGRPRLREPVRDQVELRAVDLEALLGPEHPARVIWGYVERLDLRALEEAVRAREHTPGQAPASPRLLLALWLYATSDGVGSARALERLCARHDAYRWLCGGVSVNHQGLSDFRMAQGELLDRLLTEGVAALSAAGAIDLEEAAQDGVRVRASAGAASFRRRKTLRRELRKAKRLIERLKRENEGDPGAGEARRKAAQLRAAREREARIAAALEALGEIEAERARRSKTNRTQVARQGEPRASTTDPEARVMKMADGGFRPAYNCQLASVADGQIVIAARVVASGSDRGLLPPMLEEIERRYGRPPRRLLAVGGFTKNADTEWAWERGVKLYAPPGQTRHKTDPFAPRRDDGPGVAAWRRRMKSPHGKAAYKRRAPAECLHARFRHWGLRQFLVRGLDKVAVALRWFALANNVLQGHRLLQAC
jgi:transposase